VKKVSKAILIVLAAILALGAALVVGLNLYIQSPGSQARIQEELSKSLRLPLKLTNTSVTPWSDLKITGISVPNGDANFLEASSFTASYRLLPLLEGKLIITEMRVENPKIVWRQDEKEKWRLPEPEKAAEVSREEAKTAAAEPASTPAAPIPGAELPATSETKSEKKKEKKKKDFEVVVQRFDVKNGSIELLDHQNKHVAVFVGVDMTYTKLTPEHVEGTAAIGKAIWADGLTLENVRTPFSFTRADHELSLPEITATLAGGSVRGRFLSRAEAEHTPFNGAVKFERVSLDALTVQTGGEAGQAIGELSGEFEMRGETDRMEKATGTGALDLRDGQFRQLEFFQNIGAALGLREFGNMRLKEGHADFHLSGQKIIVEQLLLATNDLQMTSKGTIRLEKGDRKVALDAQLSVDEALVKQLPSLIGDSFVAAENNRRTIDFNITGTTDKPKTNLLDKLIGSKINVQFGDLISNLFGGEKKPEDDKKKKEEEERKKAEKKAEKERKKKEKEKDKSAAVREADATSAVQPAATVANP